MIYAPSIAGLTDESPHRRDGSRCVRQAFVAGTGEPVSTYLGRDGLDVRSDLGGLNLSDVPKVLIETGEHAQRDRRGAARVGRLPAARGTRARRGIEASSESSFR